MNREDLHVDQEVTVFESGRFGRGGQQPTHPGMVTKIARKYVTIRMLDRKPDHWQAEMVFEIESQREKAASNYVAYFCTPEQIAKQEERARHDETIAKHKLRFDWQCKLSHEQAERIAWVLELTEEQWSKAKNCEEG